MITYSDYIHTEPCTILVQFCFYLITIINEFLFKNFTKGPWQKLNAALLDFSACLYHTELINRQGGI